MTRIRLYLVRLHSGVKEGNFTTPTAFPFVPTAHPPESRYLPLVLGREEPSVSNN